MRSKSTSVKGLIKRGGHTNSISKTIDEEYETMSIIKEILRNRVIARVYNERNNLEDKDYIDDFDKFWKLLEDARDDNNASASEFEANKREYEKFKQAFCETYNYVVQTRFEQYLTYFRKLFHEIEKLQNPFLINKLGEIKGYFNHYLLWKQYFDGKDLLNQDVAFTVMKEMIQGGVPNSFDQLYEGMVAVQNKLDGINHDLIGVKNEIIDISDIFINWADEKYAAQQKKKLFSKGGDVYDYINYNTLKVVELHGLYKIDTWKSLLKNAKQTLPVSELNTNIRKLQTNNKDLQMKKKAILGLKNTDNNDLKTQLLNDASKIIKEWSRIFRVTWEYINRLIPESYMDEYEDLYSTHKTNLEKEWETEYNNQNKNTQSAGKLASKRAKPKPSPKSTKHPQAKRKITTTRVKDTSKKSVAKRQHP